eukprot:429573-Pelagomonas_calceolata.AAC.5
MYRHHGGCACVALAWPVPMLKDSDMMILVLAAQMLLLPVLSAQVIMKFEMDGSGAEAKT